MSFRRRIAERHPRCEIYGCENRATLHCGVCKKLLCPDCKSGHVTMHVRQAGKG